jgi:hypothetical protein
MRELVCLAVAAVVHGAVGLVAADVVDELLELDEDVLTPAKA